jgi:RHS repeat-associated protein
VRSEGNGSYMPETNFFWDPLSDNILQERDETGAVTAEYTTEPGLYGNLVSQNRGGVESQHHFDALGSTLALTDDNEQVTDTWAYSAFGEVTEHTGSTVNLFEYVGQKEYLADPTGERMAIRRRDYGSRIGRWLSTDPLAFLTSLASLGSFALWPAQDETVAVTVYSHEYGTNSFLYAHNSPLGTIDPSGLQSIFDCPPNRVKPNPNYVVPEPTGDFCTRVPDEPFGFEFAHCCADHDYCYGHCWENLIREGQRRCDGTFLRCMQDYCNSAYSTRPFRRVLCLRIARNYYRGVRVRGGRYYRDAQEQACVCVC